MLSMAMLIDASANVMSRKSLHAHESGIHAQHLLMPLAGGGYAYDL
jgi:hypothetical protein